MNEPLRLPVVSPPRAPVHLGAAGRRLWRAVMADYVLAAHEMVTLESACRQADDLARLAAALVEAPTEVIGSTGQTRPNPLFAETRAARLALARLLDALGLDQAVRDASAKSTAGRRLARLRWGGRYGAS